MLDNEKLIKDFDILFERENVIYGAGEQGIRALESFRLAGIRVLNFCDTNHQLWGKSIEGVLVISPDELNQRRAMNRTNTIIATYNTRFIEQISEMLVDYGNDACVCSLDYLELALKNNLDNPKLSAQYRTILSSRLASSKFGGDIMYYFSRFFGSRENFDNSYKLYTKDAARWEKYLKIDYLTKEHVETQIIKDGMILPIKRCLGELESGVGGVCDSSGNFISGFSRYYGIENSLIYRAYPLKKTARRVNETVVYCGLMCEHFGHMITETLNRLWWFVENPGSGYKAAFINWFGNSEKVQFPEFLQMLGLDETDIIIVNEPTRFEAVIVPDQASYLHSGYTNKCIDVYNAIRGSVKPAGYDRVYLTKTKLVPKYLLGEEYFEDYYRSLGFEIVAPETLPIKEQVAIMAGAKEIVTTSGTTQHLILFCQDGVKLTLLNRSSQFIQQQHWIIQARAARCTFIDIFADLLPPAWYSAPHIFFPTEHWKRYLKENGMPFKDCGITVRDYIMEYLMSWISEIPKFPLHFIKHYRYYTLADMIISFHRYLCEEELEASVQEKLRAVFPRPK